jgi:hypothetical protein
MALFSAKLAPHVAANVIIFWIDFISVLFQVFLISIKSNLIKKWVSWIVDTYLCWIVEWVVARIIFDSLSHSFSFFGKI